MSTPSEPATATSGVALAVTGLTRVAGRRHILRDVSFEARGGEVLSVIGRNGAGKTTLLTLLAGRQGPDRGTVRVREDGRDAGPDRARALVGILPHDLFLYPDLSARENLAFFADLYGLGDRAARVDRTLGEVGLPRDGDRPVRTLSRGMQQRAAIGRLLVTGARIWLLDEPTTGLDEPGRRWLSGMIDARRAAGDLVLMASHHRAEVVSTATRILVLEAGRLVLDLPGGAEGTARAFDRVDGGGA